MPKHFFAMLSRMKYITRWGLMRNTRPENLSEHALEVAVLAHALALIGQKRLGLPLDPNRAATLALFHDASEILTGDLPTPVKYADPAIKSAYKQVEREAAGRLLDMLPEDLREDYRPLLMPGPADAPLRPLIKAADKLSALIKCIEEERAGNLEFRKAKESTLAAIHALDCEPAEIFLREFIPSYTLTLDEQS